MSEYNKFLNHFNKIKNAQVQESLSDREDSIPVTGAVKKNTEAVKIEESEKIQNSVFDEQAQELAAKQEPSENEENAPVYEEEKEAAAEASSQPEEKTDEIVKSEKTENKHGKAKKSRFIKSGKAQFIAVNAENRQDVPTTVTKYTDRLNTSLPEKKLSDTKPIRLNTYDDLHSPDPEAKLFGADVNDDKAVKKTGKAQTPENTAQAQTKILPVIVKEEDENGEEKGVIVEKIPDKTKEISVKGSLLREIAKTSGNNAPDEDDGQLMIEGFEEDDTENGIGKDEAEVLEELSRVREKRIRDFRFWTKSAVETGESEDKSFSPQREEVKIPLILMKIREKFSHLNTDFVPMGDNEYQDPSKRKEIFSSLMELKKVTLIKALVLLILGAVLLVINIVTAVSASMNNGFFSVLGGSVAAYNIINLVILLICGVIMADDLKKGIFSVLKIRPKTDTALLMMYMGALFQTIASFFTTLKPESEYHLLSGAVVVLCVPVLLSKAFYYDSTRHCFKAVGTTSDKCYLRKISDKETISQLLKDKNPTESNVVYAGKTRFISGFLKRSAGAAFSGQASSRVIILAAFFALICAVFGLITTKSPVYALGCFNVTAALSFPISCLFFTGFMLSSENSMLSLKASFIGSYSDAYSFSCIDDIILDGNDIFSAEIVSSAVNKNVSQKQAEFCAAVLTSKADGLLRNTFSVFSYGLQDRYPEVEGLVFEERLGLSAWISDCRVLLGTKQFLVNHNVELPEGNTIPFIQDESTRPLFLAIEGHFAAAFSVRYSCDKSTSKSLQALAANGANILLSIKDPNITEIFGEELLGLPENSLRIISENHSPKFTEQKSTVTDMEDTGIVFSESFEAFSRTLASAIKLEKIRRTSKILCEAACVAGILLGIIFCMTGALTFINGWPVVILHLCWLLLSFALTPSLSATTLRKKISLPDFTEKSRPVYPEGEDDLPDFNDDDMFREVKTEEPEYEDISDDEESSLTENMSRARDKAMKIKKRLKNAVAEKENERNHREDDEDASSQMIMQGAPYTEPPQVVDIEALEKEKEEEEEKEAENNPSKQEITDDILDSFATSFTGSSVKTFSRKPSKGGFLKKFIQGSSFDGQEEEVKTAKKEVFSVLDEKMPAPPRFDLSKKEETDSDPLNAKFIPPDTSSYQTYYKDDFFSSFDTAEDDKAFEKVRESRGKRESTADEFDFWTKK